MPLGRDWTLDPLFPIPHTYHQTILVWDILPCMPRWIRMALKANSVMEKVMPWMGFDPSTLGSAVAHFTPSPIRLIVKAYGDGRSCYWETWRSSRLVLEIVQRHFRCHSNRILSTRGSDCYRARIANGCLSWRLLGPRPLERLPFRSWFLILPLMEKNAARPVI